MLPIVQMMSFIEKGHVFRDLDIFMSVGQLFCKTSLSLDVALWLDLVCTVGRNTPENDVPCEETRTIDLIQF